ncbi:MAG: putative TRANSMEMBRANE PROTEIN [Ignavibacteriae bacterium]|nr:MAG: putative TRANSMEMBRANE PROTEIN [Ignavibacteriota bacterium]
MNIIFLIFSFLFLFLTSTILFKRTDIFSPARLFSLVWVFVLGLCSLKLSRFQYDWSIYSWYVLLITLTSFLLGTFVVYVLNFGKNIPTIPIIREIQSQKIKVNTYTIFKTIVFLFFIYIISYIIIYSIVDFLPAFSKKPHLNRATWGVFGFGLFIHLTPIIIFLSIAYFIHHKNLTRKFIITNIFLITFISFILLEQRFGLVFAIILAFVYLYYSSTKISIKNFLLSVIPIIAIIYGLTTLRESKYFIYYLYYLSNMKYSINYALFTEPYMYIVMNVENFAYAIEKTIHHTYGFYSFDFILALSGLKHFLKEYFGFNDFPALRTALYNTYSMFFIYYRDFGLIGSFIFPFLLGILISHAYYKMRYNPNFHTISLYAILVIGIIFSYFIPLFSWLYFIFDVLVIYFISRYIQQKSKSIII